MFTVQRRINKNVYPLSLLILSRARNNVARISSARKQGSCRRFPGNHGWWENVWRNFSKKSFEKTFRVSRATLLNKIQAVRAIVKQVRMLRLKNSTQNLGTNGTVDWSNNIVSSSETNSNRTCTIHDPHDRWDEPMSSP